MLSRKLDITGSASVDPINWKIYFDNISEVEKQGEAAVVSNPEIDSNIKTKIANFNVILNKPGDKATFTVDLVNESDITAIIDKIDTPTINYDFIEFKAIYTGTNVEVKEGDVIKAKTVEEESRTNIEISVYYSKENVTNEDLKNIPAEGLEIAFSYALTFVQSDKVANMPTTKWLSGCTEFTKKDTYEVGDVISFCNKNARYTNSDGVYVKGKSEDFYVISDNGDTVTALARYNLMAGSKATDTFATAFPGLQANTTDTYPVAFSNKDENRKKTGCTGNYCYLGYWTQESGNLLENYGASYPADVFDENSLMWEYVQNYKTYFENTLNMTVTDMRLITYDELVDLGCDRGEHGINSTCRTDTVTANKREWIYNTWYCSSSAGDYYTLWRVDKFGTFCERPFYEESLIGIRPVITISKTDM